MVDPEHTGGIYISHLAWQRLWGRLRRETSSVRTLACHSTQSVGHLKCVSQDKSEPEITTYQTY